MQAMLGQQLHTSQTEEQAYSPQCTALKQQILPGEEPIVYYATVHQTIMRASLSLLPSPHNARLCRALAPPSYKCSASWAHETSPNAQRVQTERYSTKQHPLSLTHRPQSTPHP
jgi:hypothetical protein